MTQAERLNSLHRWIQSLGTFTVRELVAELEGLRKGPKPEQYADLPADGISCQELLEKLEAEGRAKRDGSFWRWAEPAVKKAEQSVLF